jgi:tetratricopeptide (TPR) repeat protein
MTTFEQALVLHRKGNIAEAESLCRQILKSNNSDFDALYMLGVICAQRNQFNEAERLLRTALSAGQSKPSCYHLYGIVLCKVERYEEAISNFNTALELAHDYPAIYLDRGFAQMKLERFLDALDSYEKTLTLDPQSVSAHYNLGVALEKLERYEEALSSYDQALANNPQYALAHCNRSAILYELKRYPEALASCDCALSLDPNLAQAHRNRAGILYELKRYPEALASCDRTLALDPDLARSHCNRGDVLDMLKRYPEALASYDRALALDPNLALAHCNRAAVLCKLYRFEEALASCDEAISLKPDFAEAFSNRGNALVELKRYEEALSSYDKVIAFDPAFAGAFRNRGGVLLALGRLEEAITSLERGTALAPTDTQCSYNLTIARRVTETDSHFATMKELAQDEESLESDAKIRLHFALGKAFADVGDSKQSFHHVLKGNSLKRQQVNYLQVQELGLFDRIRRAYTAELLDEKCGLGDPSPVPIFIVGMPRSGTTLVEQILASHPQVFGAGEIEEFRELAATIRTPNLGEFPEAIATISGAELHALGAGFVQKIRLLAPTAERITDKMLANFCYVGLFHLALPNAPIIHVRRDPRDTAFSCFSTLFLGEHLPYTYDLAELGRYIRAYQVLMDHWRKTLPRGVMLEVQYEEIVDDLSEQARRIIAHCGLQWDNACLEFHRTERVVRTASVVQVRQPIYRSSIGRWRDYEDLLQPLLLELKA